MSAKILKWYFSVNEDGLKRPHIQDLIKVAVRSAQAHTRLQPHCIYGGNNESQIDFLKSLGVTVICHTPSIEPELRVGYGDFYNKFYGHWLRVDLPTIEQTEQVVLYTDIDVMFMGEIPDTPVPERLAAAPEISMDNFSYFNSGVLVLNIPQLQAIQDDFIASIKARLLNDFKYPAHDQESFNRYFSSSYDRLNLGLNWKPYWGWNDDTRILHFHGPKPHTIRQFEQGEFSKSIAGHIRLWKKDPQSYSRYVEVFEKFLP